MLTGGRKRSVLERTMRWSESRGPYDDDYYEQATFVLVKESPKAIRIKLIDKYRENYDGLVFWMPKSITKDYDDSNPNIKTAWFWEKLFYDNVNKALKNRARTLPGFNGIPKKLTRLRFPLDKKPSQRP